MREAHKRSRNPRVKKQYWVKNWSRYDKALRDRGDITVWFSEDAIDAWEPKRSGKPGRQRRYSDLAIETVLTTGPVAVVEAKSLTDSFDRWMGTDEELREWVLDKTSEMRASTEGQEGLAAFLEGRKPTWSSEDQDG